MEGGEAGAERHQHQPRMSPFLARIARAATGSLGVSLLLMAGSMLGRQSNVEVAVLLLIPLGVGLLEASK